MGLRPSWDKLSQRRNNRKRRQKKKEEDEVEEAQEKEEEEEEAAETAAAAQSVIERFKKVLNSLAIWKIQSITALRFHLNHCQSDQHPENYQVLVRIWGKRNPFSLLGQMWTSTITAEIRADNSQKQQKRIESLSNSAITLMCIHLENSYHTDICTSIFTIALYTIAKKWNKPRCPSTDK